MEWCCKVSDCVVNSINFFVVPTEFGFQILNSLHVK
jgi:hypothetical protein